MTVHTELMRGAGPIAVLQLLAGGEMYGYELIGVLDQATSGVLAMGQSTLYPMLYHLEAKGLIAGRWRKADTGRRRKYYRITSEGEATLRERRAEWVELVSAMRDLGLLQAGADS